jgi:hypothetical protein
LKRVVGLAVRVLAIITALGGVPYSAISTRVILLPKRQQILHSNRILALIQQLPISLSNSASTVFPSIISVPTSAGSAASTQTATTSLLTNTAASMLVYSNVVSASPEASAMVVGSYHSPKPIEIKYVYVCS